jgi:hypothetical protein
MSADCRDGRWAGVDVYVDSGPETVKTSAVRHGSFAILLVWGETSHPRRPPSSLAATFGPCFAARAETCPKRRITRVVTVGSSGR